MRKNIFLVILSVVILMPLFAHGVVQGLPGGHGFFNSDLNKFCPVLNHVDLKKGSRKFAQVIDGEVSFIVGCEDDQRKLIYKRFFHEKPSMLSLREKIITRPSADKDSCNQGPWKQLWS